MVLGKQLTDITPNTQSRNWIVDGDNYSNTATTIEHDFFTLGKKTVSLIVTDVFGCKGVKTFVDTIEVLPNLEFDFDADFKQGCIPQTVNFSLTKDPSSIYAKKYYWDFPGATNERDSGLTPPARTYDKVGSYDITLTVILNNGCTYTKEKKGFVKFGDVINLNLTTSKTSSCLKTNIELTQTVPNLPGNLSWSYSGVPVNVVCIYGSPKILVPSAFTPNGEGTNDVFMPHTKYFNDGSEAGDFLFMVYNRWGEKVFEITQTSKGWDGTFMGEDCQQGVYAYKIQARSLVVKFFNEKGTVTLLR